MKNHRSRNRGHNDHNAVLFREEYDVPVLGLNLTVFSDWLSTDDWGQDIGERA
jgi:hypothetical protein